MQSTFPSRGHTIRLDSALPATPGRHPAILLLHGSGGNIGFWLDRIAPFLTRPQSGRPAISLFAPHYFDSTNTSRAQPAHFTDGIHVPAWLNTIRDTLAHIRTLPTVDPSRIALVGISLGGFLALALGAESCHDRALNLKAIVEISAGLAPPWDQQATPIFPPTLILHGDADTTVPVSYAHALDTLLTRLNVPHQALILPGEGHWFSPVSAIRILSAIAQFLSSHL